jgi:hypothetical protein
LTLGARRLLALGARCLLVLAFSLLLFGTRGLLVIVFRPRKYRGCDRQRGDTRGEKYPGHHTHLLLNGLNGPLGAPFQRLVAKRRGLPHQREPEMSLLFR